MLPKALPFSPSLERKLWHSSLLRTVRIHQFISLLTHLKPLLQRCHQTTQAHNRTDATRPGHALSVPGLQILPSVQPPRPQSWGEWPGYSCQLWDRELELAQATLGTQKISYPSPSKPSSCWISSDICRSQTLFRAVLVFSVTCDAVAKLLSWNFSQETRSTFHSSLWASI